MKREDEAVRRTMYRGHPPYFTCVECNRRRLARKRGGSQYRVGVIIGVVVVWLMYKAQWIEWC